MTEMYSITVPVVNDPVFLALFGFIILWGFFKLIIWLWGNLLP